MISAPPSLNRPLSSSLRIAAAVALALAMTSARSSADSGTWNVDAAGNWSLGTNWLNGVVADGAMNTANFAFDLTAARTVTLDTNRTIGNLVFEDTGASGDVAWTLAASAGKVLTLDNGGTSTITNNSGQTLVANTGDVTISAPLAGTGNVIFNNSQASGDGNSIRTIQVTNSASTYSGTTTIQNGSVNVGANNLLSGINGPLGNSASAIILGNASTLATPDGRPNVFLTVQGNSSAAAQNFLINRDIDSSLTASVSGDTNIRFSNGNGGATGILTVSGNWTLSPGATRRYGVVAQRPGMSIDFTGAIVGGSNTGSFRINDFTSGNGTVRLSNPGNTYGGATTILTGGLLIANNAAAASGVLGTNATLALGENGATSSAVSALIDGAFTVGKTITLGANSTSVYTWELGGHQAATSSFTGNVNSQSSATSRTLNLSQVAGGTVSFGGVIGANANAAGVTNVAKIGAGAAILSGANVYDGTTTLSAGNLLVAGSVAGDTLTVQSGATLGGSGVINSGIAASTVEVAGTLAPGGKLDSVTPANGAISSPGNLTSNKTVNFLTGSTYTVELNGTISGTEYDRLTIASTSSISINAASNFGLTLGYAPSVGDSFTVIDNQSASPISGAFGNLAEGAILNTVYSSNTYSLLATYTGGSGSNDLVLTVASSVPEPSTVVSMLGGVGMLLALRRRRAQS